MDVEIVKSNGQKFRLSDYGVVQDFVVNSIDRSVTRESVDGRKGSVDYGTNIGDRSISVPMIFKARDLLDYAHLRDELFGILDDDEPFYIREMRRKDYLQYEFVDFGQSPTWSNGVENEYVNGKHYKVRLDSSISPEQWDDKPNGDITIEFVTSGLPFAESIYTTLELHDSGYSATAEKYGLVDNIDDEKVKYRFEPENTFNLNLIPLDTGSWERGARWSGGTNNNNSTDIRLKMADAIPITEGQTYTFQDNSSYNSRLSSILVHCFDDKGNMVYYFSRARGGNSTFTARGTKLVISLRAMDGYVIPLDYIEGDRLRVKLEEGDRHTGMNPSSELFTVYNAGNVTVEPESMFLHIIANTVTTSGGFTITNHTTGDEFIYHGEINGQSILLKGMDMRVSSIYNRLRDTNRQFLRLAPGDNKIEVSGGTFNHIRFDFRYLYK